MYVSRTKVMRRFKK